MRPLLLIAALTITLSTTSARADDPKQPDDPKPATPPTSAPDPPAAASTPTPIVHEPQRLPPAQYLEHPGPSASAEPAKPLLLPGILAGSGLVLITTGILLAVTAPDTPASCNSDTKTCVRLPNQTNESFSDDQDRAGRAHTQPIAGWLTVGLGGMLVTAGVLSYFMSDRPGRPRVSASVGPTGGSLSLTMRTF